MQSLVEAVSWLFSADELCVLSDESSLAVADDALEDSLLSSLAAPGMDAGAALHSRPRLGCVLSIASFIDLTLCSYCRAQIDSKEWQLVQNALYFRTRVVVTSFVPLYLRIHFLAKCLIQSCVILSSCTSHSTTLRTTGMDADRMCTLNLRAVCCQTHTGIASIPALGRVGATTSPKHTAHRSRPRAKTAAETLQMKTKKKTDPA